MSSEKDMRGRVVRILKCMDAVAVENPVGAGTPDVNFIGGWMELKSRSAWPVRPETILEVEHYTQTQRIWSLQRWRRGGLMLHLLKVGNDWLLFDGNVAPLVVGKAPKKKLLEAARRVWLGGLNEDEFRECLKTISLPERNST